MSVAHELSGLGSTRVVRFSASRWRRIDEPDDVATGPENAEVSRCFEPLGTAGAFGDGGWGTVGVFGATVPALSAAFRGGGPGRPAGQALGEAIGEAGAGG